MTSIDKALIKRKFGTGIESYHREAEVQKNMAHELSSELLSLHLPHDAVLFEIGCGSGFLTRNILEKLKFKHLYANDIAHSSECVITDLLKGYSKSLSFIEGDAETMPFPPALDLVISSSTIQWFGDKQSFFDHVSNSLNEKGILAFSTFGGRNFMEIKSLTGIGLHYESKKTLTEMLSDKFTIHTSREWEQHLEFDRPSEVLHHIKRTGVNALTQNYFGKKQLEEFTQNYVRHFSNNSGKVTLTYHPMIIIAQKK